MRSILTAIVVVCLITLSIALLQSKHATKQPTPAPMLLSDPSNLQQQLQLAREYADLALKLALELVPGPERTRAEKAAAEADRQACDLALAIDLIARSRSDNDPNERIFRAEADTCARAVATQLDIVKKISDAANATVRNRTEYAINCATYAAKRANSFRRQATRFAVSAGVYTPDNSNYVIFSPADKHVVLLLLEKIKHHADMATISADTARQLTDQHEITTARAAEQHAMTAIMSAKSVKDICLLLLETVDRYAVRC